MRITNTAMVRSHLYDTQQNLSRMNKINEQINSGKVVNRVSDDPHKAIRIMNMNNEIKYTEKYNYNIDETVGWMNNTDASLENFGNLLKDIKDNIIKVGNGTYSQEEMKALNAEMNEKIKEIADVLNTTHGGKYMFGGSNVEEAPIKLIENPDGTVKLEINQNSNTEDLKADISDGTSIDYMFGGSNVEEAPIKLIENPDGTVKLEINQNSNTEDLKADISDGTSIDYNVSVGEIFNVKDENGNTVNLLDEVNKLSELMNDIANGDEQTSAKARKELL